MDIIFKLMDDGNLLMLVTENWKLLSVKLTEIFKVVEQGKWFQLNGKWEYSPLNIFQGNEIWWKHFRIYEK